MTSNSPEILSVHQLTKAAKDLLETYLPALWVEGEISNLSVPSSGHWYFTLKDDRAQVRCAMFRNRNIRVRFKPQNGDKVLMRAQVSLYEARGDFQLIAEHIEPAGLGDLQRKFEILKARLGAEGLFDAEHKQALPRWPKRVGVITSPSGAAVRDIIHVLRRRFPALDVLVIPVAVQGKGSEREIAAAIRQANTHPLCDVLIVGRGGGSIEDLWAFNEEVVARAVFQSDIPIVSAVGHEVDFTICDFVADVRAPTPSVAAELVSQNRQELDKSLVMFHNRLQKSWAQQLADKTLQIKHLRARLQHPRQRLQSIAQQFDQQELRLRQALKVLLQTQQVAVNDLNRRMLKNSPTQIIAGKANAAQDLSLRLIQSQRQLLNRKQESLGRMAHLLHNVSPLKTLERGYAIVLDEDGRNVTDSSEVQPGAEITARLNKGQLKCQVIAREGAEYNHS